MVSCLMGDSTALASAIVRCCLNLIIYFVYVFPICKTEEKRKKTYFLQKSPAYFQ